MRILLYIYGSGADINALRGPISMLKECNPGIQIDVMLPRALASDLLGHPDVRTFLFNSDFGVPDNMVARKIPRKVVEGLARGYTKVINCCLYTNFPSVPSGVPVEAKEELYGKIFAKHGLLIVRPAPQPVAIAADTPPSLPPAEVGEEGGGAQLDAEPALQISAEDEVEDCIMYKDLSDEQFVSRQFLDFYGRIPNMSELSGYLRILQSSTRQQFNDDFAYGAESFRRSRCFRFPPADQPAPCKYTGDARVAILLCGHLRTFKQTYPKIRQNMVLPMKADVFIHTWDSIGMQSLDHKYGPVPNESQAVNLAEVYQLIPETVDLKVENNKKFIDSAKTANSKPYVYGGGGGASWHMLSAKPVFIESQLYSLNEAFNLMQRHEEKIGKKYDIVIKLRSDMEVSRYEINGNAIGPDSLWVPSPPNSNHGHPLCFACARGPHEGRHAADVCDVYAYGGRAAMGHYCSVWSNLDAVYGRMCEENEINIKNRAAHHGLVDGHVAVPIWHNPETHRLHCFYPERIFRLYLEGWHLRAGTMVCRIIR